MYIIIFLLQFNTTQCEIVNTVLVVLVCTNVIKRYMYFQKHMFNNAFSFGLLMQIDIIGLPAKQTLVLRFLSKANKDIFINWNRDGCTKDIKCQYRLISILIT